MTKREKEETEFLAVHVNKEVVGKFKELVRSNGYSQKFVIYKLISMAVNDFENKELKNMGWLLDADKRTS